MFNEKNNYWISLYKLVVVVSFFLWVLFGLRAGIGDASAEFLDIGIGGDDDGFCDFIVWFLLGGAIGFVQLAVNMLLIQFLRNVQIIREHMETLGQSYLDVVHTVACDEVGHKKEIDLASTALCEDSEHLQPEAASEKKKCCLNCGQLQDDAETHCIHCGEPF